MYSLNWHYVNEFVIVKQTNIADLFLVLSIYGFVNQFININIYIYKELQSILKANISAFNGGCSNYLSLLFQL